jgi:mRNA-degrading endonuclease toxin of MazEF toxin-antitoxin module
VIQVVPITACSQRESAIIANVSIEVTPGDGLDKHFIADCLLTRPIDRRHRVSGIRGMLDEATMDRVDTALRLVFEL